MIKFIELSNLYVMLLVITQLIVIFVSLKFKLLIEAIINNKTYNICYYKVRIIFKS